MAITASGLYLLTEEKRMIDTVGLSMESETSMKGALVLDAYTPNFDTHDFWNDVSANEVTGTTNYTAGGSLLTTTEVTVGSPAAGQIKFDVADPAWASSTIPNAMALVGYYVVGSSATDMLHFLLDFVTAVSSVAGALTVQIAANGVYYIDGTP